jgi:hypothetical protein
MRDLLNFSDSTLPLIHGCSDLFDRSEPPSNPNSSDEISNLARNHKIPEQKPKIAGRAKFYSDFMDLSSPFAASQPPPIA